MTTEEAELRSQVIRAKRRIAVALDIAAVKYPEVNDPEARSIIEIALKFEGLTLDDLPVPAGKLPAKPAAQRGRR